MQRMSRIQGFMFIQSIMCTPLALGGAKLIYLMGIKVQAVVLMHSGGQCEMAYLIICFHHGLLWLITRMKQVTVVCQRVSWSFSLTLWLFSAVIKYPAAALFCSLSCRQSQPLKKQDNYTHNEHCREEKLKFKLSQVYCSMRERERERLKCAAGFMKLDRRTRGKGGTE